MKSGVSDPPVCFQPEVPAKAYWRTARVQATPAIWPHADCLRSSEDDGQRGGSTFCDTLKGGDDEVREESRFKDFCDTLSGRSYGLLASQLGGYS